MDCVPSVYRPPKHRIKKYISESQYFFNKNEGFQINYLVLYWQTRAKELVGQYGGSF